MNKRFLAFFAILSLVTHVHAFDVKPYIQATGTRIKNTGRSIGNSIISTTQDIGKIIYPGNFNKSI